MICDKVLHVVGHSWPGVEVDAVQVLQIKERRRKMTSQLTNDSEDGTKW